MAVKKKKVAAKPAADTAAAPAAPAMKFTYTITNDGSKIRKDFQGEATPQDVIITLFSCMIGDIKTNIDPLEYKNILDFLVVQYRAQLLPEEITDAK